MSRRERGQALVEAVAAFPICMACALVLVDAGVVVRDRIAVTQAATQAAAAQLDGRDAEGAATRTLPASLEDVRIEADATTITVRATSRPALVGALGIEIEQRSTVEVSA